MQWLREQELYTLCMPISLAWRCRESFRFFFLFLRGPPLRAQITDNPLSLCAENAPLARLPCATDKSKEPFTTQIFRRPIIFQYFGNIFYPYILRQADALSGEDGICMPGAVHTPLIKPLNSHYLQSALNFVVSHSLLTKAKMRAHHGGRAR